MKIVLNERHLIVLIWQIIFMTRKGDKLGSGGGTKLAGKHNG